MELEFGLTEELFDTQFGPLAGLFAYYHAQNLFEPLKLVTPTTRKNASLPDKYIQTILSIMCGCRYLNDVNAKLRCERKLAQVNRISIFAEQSTLSLAINRLSQTNFDQLSIAIRQICDCVSQVRHHDWRGHLLLDFDLSGLPCGRQAEGAARGYFSGKKTLLAVNWHG